MQSLDTGVLPSDLLLANVCPVFKKENQTNVTNYQPISLTSVCSKTMEHILYHHLSWNTWIHTTFSLIINMAFVPTTFVSHTLSHWFFEDLSYVYALDQQKYANFIILKRLIAFLTRDFWLNWISSSTCQWIYTWLIHRSQQVVLDGAFSEPVPVYSGVPQGIVLDPLMILLHLYI